MNGKPSVDEWMAAIESRLEKLEGQVALFNTTAAPATEAEQEALAHPVTGRVTPEQQRDADQFAEKDPDKCMICHAHGKDKRGFYIDCLWAMKDIAPEFIDLHGVPGYTNRGFYLRLCKACRTAALRGIQDAFNNRRALRGTAMLSDGSPD